MLWNLRFAVRMLLKRPGFTALAALTLAVGIGATAAVFSLVEGVLVSPPPYRDPDRLVIIPSVRIDSQQVERIEGVPAIHWMDWQQHATSFESIVSLWQSSAFSKDLVVRTASQPRAVIEAIRRELASVDPTVAVERVKTLDDIRADSLASRIFTQQLLVGFAFVGTVLTVVGVYGVLALSVAARRREIAIRSAIGAHHRDIRNLVFGEGFRLVAVGVAIGLAGALLASRVLQSFLFEVEPTDPVTLAAAGALFVAVSVVACWVPTRRATAVDPLEALRCE